MAFWFDPRGKDYAGEDEKNWLKSYVDREMTSHKDLSPLDHPNGSVTSSKIEDGAVTDEKIGTRLYDGNTYKLSGWIKHFSDSIKNVLDALKLHKDDKKNPHSVTKEQVGLGSVNNTSDENKPLSVEMRKALDEKVNNSVFNSHKDASILDHPNNSVREQHINDNSISSGKIKADAVTDVKIGNRTVDDPCPDNGTYSGYLTQIFNHFTLAIREFRAKFEKHRNDNPIDHPDGSVITEKLANVCVTTAKIRDKAIVNSKLDDESVSTSKLQPCSVTTEKIYDKAVTTEKLNDSAVTTIKIYDKAVTTGKINDSAVTTIKIADNNVTDEKIGERTVNQAINITAANKGTLTFLLSWLAKMIKAVTGKTNWYDMPVKSIEQLQSEKAPNYHADASNKYGAASVADFGHIKIASDSDVNLGNDTENAVTPKQLKTVITAEEKARGEEDRRLDTLINTEKSTRESAINLLQDLINTLARDAQILYLNGRPLYGTTFVDKDENGRYFINEDGSGDYLISRLPNGRPYLRYTPLFSLDSGRLSYEGEV